MEQKLIEDIEALVSERIKAIKSGDMARANKIANELAHFGVRLTDEKNGTKWEVF